MEKKHNADYERCNLNLGNKCNVRSGCDVCGYCITHCLGHFQLLGYDHTYGIKIR